jgi:hypothetical protein
MISMRRGGVQVDWQKWLRKFIDDRIHLEHHSRFPSSILRIYVTNDSPHECIGYVFHLHISLWGEKREPHAFKKIRLIALKRRKE